MFWCRREAFQWDYSRFTLLWLKWETDPQCIHNCRSNMIFFFLGWSCSSSAWTATHVWPSVTWPSCITRSTNMSWKLVPYLKSLKLEYSIRGCRGTYQTQSREFVMDRLLGQPLSCYLKVLWKRRHFKRLLVWLCGCSFYTGVRRIKPQADFGKFGLTDGLGGEHLGQKEHCLGDRALFSALLSHQLVLEHGPQWVGNHTG